jgi:hypothetical protein
MVEGLNLKKESFGYMIVYEFYYLDPIEGCQIFGVLPERRKNPARITQDSVINWGIKYFGNILDINDIFFIQVTIDENKGGIFRPTPFFETKEKM